MKDRPALFHYNRYTFHLIRLAGCLFLLLFQFHLDAQDTYQTMYSEVYQPLNPINSADDFIRPKRWYGGGAMGIGFNKDKGLVLADIYGGYAGHRLLHIGVVAGIHLTQDETEDHFIPIQLEWRGYWLKRAFSPYTVARFGTTFGLYSDEDGDAWFREERNYRPGLNVELLAGIRLGHLGPSHFALETGYLRQSVSYTANFRSPWGPIEEYEVERIQQRWVFRLVIGF